MGGLLRETDSVWGLRGRGEGEIEVGMLGVEVMRWWERRGDGR